MKRAFLAAMSLAVLAGCAASAPSRPAEPAATAPAQSPASPPAEPGRPEASGAKESVAAPRHSSPPNTSPFHPEAPAGGPRVLALPPSHQPVVSLQLRFRSGAVDDPPGKAGLTLLAATVMTEGGTQALSAKQLLETLFPGAAELAVRVDKEQTTFSLRVHKDQLATLVPVLTDVLLHPRWDPQEFARLREMAVNDVEKRLRQGDDENLGKEALGELMYRGHPYGRLTLGHVGDLAGMTLEEVKAHAGRVFTADRLTIGVAGGYPAELPQKLLRTLSQLPAQGAPPPEVPQATPHGPRFLLVEKRSDSTAVSMGYPWALSRRDPDWAALSIARSIFGEHRQMTGRLMQRLREQRGLNYGDYAYLEHFEQEGGNAATAQTGRARTQQDFTIWLRPVKTGNRLFAVRAALFELQRSLGDEPFTEEEVARAKGFLDGYLLLFDETDARKLGYALDGAFYGTDDFLASWRASLGAVTAAQVNAAWRKWIDPAKLEIVMAGRDMAQVKQALVASAPTPIQYARDAQGKAIEKDKAQQETDARMERAPFGVSGEADVELVPVERMFQ